MTTLEKLDEWLGKSPDRRASILRGECRLYIAVSLDVAIEYGATTEEALTRALEAAARRPGLK